MSMNMLFLYVIFIPLFGSLFVLLSKQDENQTCKNGVHTALMTILVNILLIFGLFSMVGQETPRETIKYSFEFLKIIRFSFGADVLTLLFMLGSQMAILAGVLGVTNEKQNQKKILVYALMYLSFLNGYFFALDIMSFFVFFTLQIYPLYMLIGLSLPQNRHTNLVRLCVHHFLGVALLFVGCVFILSLKQNDILLAHIDKLHLSYKKSIMVWGGLFFALILRVPVWPFHHALTSVWTVVKNPLALTCLYILPLTGIYGFMRCWPLNIPFEISVLSPVFQTLCVVTMVFAALGEYANFGTKHKLSNYIFVYDLLYLLAVFLPTDIIWFNIAYSIFAFLLISSCLVVVEFCVVKQSLEANINVRGVLCRMPRASLVYSLFVLAAAQLPVSAFFGNNFVIVSKIFNFHLYMGIAVVICMTFAVVSLLQGLYTLKDESCAYITKSQIKDLDLTVFVVMMVFAAVLFLSLVNPLWFVFLKGL